MGTRSRIRSLFLSSFVLIAAPLCSQGVDSSIGTIEQDLQSYIAGDVVQFATTGHPKAGGVELTLKLPKRWAGKEGVRPHIVQLFSAGLSPERAVTCTVLIQSLPLVALLLSHDALVEAFLSEEGVKNSVPKGCEVLLFKSTKYDGEVGALYAYVMPEQERAGFSVSAFVVSQRFFYAGKMVEVGCSIGGSSDGWQGVDLKSETQTFVLLCQMIGNSIVLPKKWR